MTETSWQLNGQYYETCNCDMLCPCILQQMAVEPTNGDCSFAMGFKIDRGKYGSETLDGLGFVLLGYTPGAMGNGNWSVGLVIDDRASTEQRDAITAIASGAAGGPMAGLSGLIGKFLGVESAAIEFDDKDGHYSVKAGNLVDIAGQPALGIDPHPPMPLQLSNTGHPAANPVNVARGMNSHVNALGLSWDASGGKHSGLFAPFSWRSA